MNAAANAYVVAGVVVIRVVDTSVIKARKKQKRMSLTRISNSNENMKCNSCRGGPRVITCPPREKKNKQIQVQTSQKLGH